MPKQSSLSNNSGKFRIQYEEQLNSSQLQAVTTTEGPLLVIAGAAVRTTVTAIVDCLSFDILQVISYLIDVYRGQFPASRT